jgi:GNAT superfamily N-acetyltransferase
VTAELTIREAEQDDFRGHLPKCVWEGGMAMPWTGGADRTSSSVCWAEANGQKVGMLTGRAVGGELASAEAHASGTRGQRSDIEAMAAGTWLIQGLGVDPDWRDRGVNAFLLGEASRRASVAGLVGLSTIIGDKAADLIGWFEHEGFTVRAECVGATCFSGPMNLVLLVRETVH